MDEAEVFKIVCILRQECLVFAFVFVFSWQPCFIFKLAVTMYFLIFLSTDVYLFLAWLEWSALAHHLNVCCNASLHFIICDLRVVNESDLHKLLKLQLTVKTLNMFSAQSDTSFCYILIWSSFFFLLFQGVRDGKKELINLKRMCVWALGNKFASCSSHWTTIKIALGDLS